MFITPAEVLRSRYAQTQVRKLPMTSLLIFPCIPVSSITIKGKSNSSLYMAEKVASNTKSHCISYMLRWAPHKLESQSGLVGKLPVSWGWAVLCATYSSFLHYLQLAGHDLAAICKKKWRKSKFQWTSWWPYLGPIQAPLFTCDTGCHD